MISLLLNPTRDHWKTAPYLPVHCLIKGYDLGYYPSTPILHWLRVGPWGINCLAVLSCPLCGLSMLLKPEKALGHCPDACSQKPLAHMEMASARGLWEGCWQHPLWEVNLSLQDEEVFGMWEGILLLRDIYSWTCFLFFNFFSYWIRSWPCWPWVCLKCWRAWDVYKYFLLRALIFYAHFSCKAHMEQWKFWGFQFR